MDTSLFPNEILYHVLSYTDGIPARVCHLWRDLSQDKRIHMRSVSTPSLLEWAQQQSCQSWTYEHTSTRPEPDTVSIIRDVYSMVKYDRDTEEYLRTGKIKVSKWTYNSSAERKKLLGSAIEEVVREASSWRLCLLYSCAFYGYTSLFSLEDLHTEGRHDERVVRKELFSAPEWNGHNGTLWYLNSLGCQRIFSNNYGGQCLQRKVGGSDFCEKCKKGV